jgi:2-C-methyl-D-erythritol 2,4-cyclodiphosphate synthase
VRIGQGFDVHRLVPGRKLILGGVEIDHPLGLLGHSDADVLVHALGDALLGAAGLGDLGAIFPDTDPAFKDADSLKLLAEIIKLLKDKNLRVVNVDLTLLAEKPKVGPFREEMRARLSETMGLGPEYISIKATTTEGLGLVGREEGLAALAVALLDEARG